VIDGDSVELEIDGEEVEVRLLNVNAPELYGPAGPGDGEADLKTCNGLAAKDALALLLDGEPLAVTGTETDRFGRLLADVTAGERSTTVDMIELGWGLATGEDPALRDRMKRAAGDRVGMWGDLCGTPQAFGLAIGETQVNPAGSDRENLNDEWVTLVNQGAEPVDLSGWTIRDDTTSHRYLLQSTLEPGAELTVRSGAGSSTDGDVYLNETFPVWSNRGETVLLVDPKGVLAVWAFVDPPTDG
jgi:micrococcal nuclease